MTEDGTHKVMSLTDEMGENRSQIVALLTGLKQGLNPDSAEVVTGILERPKADETRLTNINVALSFQDLVAQRVAKLVTVLEEVQRKLLKLVVVFGIQKDAANDRVKEGRGDDMLKQLEASKDSMRATISRKRWVSVSKSRRKLSRIKLIETCLSDMETFKQSERIACSVSEITGTRRVNMTMKWCER